MNAWKKISFALATTLWLIILNPTSSLAQAEGAQPASDGIAMADTFYQDGKIYVVVAVILLIFSGLIAYAFRIDQKVSKLERELQDEFHR